MLERDRSVTERPMHAVVLFSAHALQPATNSHTFQHHLLLGHVVARVRSRRPRLRFVSGMLAHVAVKITNGVGIDVQCPESTLEYNNESQRIFSESHAVLDTMIVATE